MVSPLAHLIGVHGWDPTHGVCATQLPGASSPLVGFVRTELRFRALHAYPPVVGPTVF